MFKLVGTYNVFWYSPNFIICTPLMALATTGGEAEAAAPDLTSNTMQDTAHTRAYYDSTRF